jgi:hypothetical protein
MRRLTHEPRNVTPLDGAPLNGAPLNGGYRKQLSPRDIAEIPARGAVKRKLNRLEAAPWIGGLVFRNQVTPQQARHELAEPYGRWRGECQIPNSAT